MARGKSVRLLASIPERYSPDFMDRLDKRTILGKAVLERYQSVMSDLGGEEGLSTIKCSLVRRLTWFEVMLQGMECRAAAGEQIDIGSWTQLTNSWLGICRMLGLERQAKADKTLRDYWNEPDEPEQDPEPPKPAEPDAATATTESAETPGEQPA